MNHGSGRAPEDTPRLSHAVLFIVSVVRLNEAESTSPRELPLQLFQEGRQILFSDVSKTLLAQREVQANIGPPSQIGY